MVGTGTARLGRRASRIATAGLVAVLLAVTAIVLVTAGVNAAAARSADVSSRLSDDYRRAATAVAAQESLERKYRLEPGPEVRARYDAAVNALVAALRDVRTDGTAEDVRTVDEVLATPRPATAGSL